MALVQNWLPPSKENWDWIVYVFALFPLFTASQWAITWYPAGKTSGGGPFNIPGKIAWITMEVPGFLTVLYIVHALPSELGLDGVPFENKVMAGLFVIHYIYRAIISPILNPSMSPIHVVVWSSAIVFQLLNGISIGGWLGGYGPTTTAEWVIIGKGKFAFGILIWALGFIGNIYHDDELREIRRSALRDQKKRQHEQDAKGERHKGVQKMYAVPENGLFRWVLFPHYLCEWIEWAGFWLTGGVGCVPARTFVLNEISTMLPRAVAGKKWYVERFGKEKIGNRKAIIPGLV